MAVLTSSLDTPVTPSVGEFDIDVAGDTLGGMASITIWRRPSASDEWAPAERMTGAFAVIATQTVVGTQWKVTGPVGTTLRITQ